MSSVVAVKRQRASTVGIAAPWTLALITSLGAGLRLFRLGEWSFWIDEVITVDQAEPLSLLDAGREPLFRVLIGASLDLFGVSEWSARLVPALIGIVTIPILYALVRRVYGEPTALLASALLAVAPWHIYWSQNARFYTLLLLLYTGALFALYEGLERDRRWLLVLAGGLLFLAGRERPVALFLLPVAGAYLVGSVLLRFERPPGLNRHNLLLLLALGAGISVLITGAFIDSPTQWEDNFGGINTDPLWIFSGVLFYVGVPTVVLAGFGGAYLGWQRDRTALLLGLSAAVPLLAVMLLSMVQYAANRYIFMTLPSYLILASALIAKLALRSDPISRLMVASVAAVLILSSLSEDVLYFQYQNGNREDMRSAVEVVQGLRSANDWVVSAAPAVTRYYLGESVTGMEAVDLTAVTRSGQTVWFIEDMNAAMKFPEVHSWMTRNAELVADLDVNVRARNFVMRVYRYDPPEG